MTMQLVLGPSTQKWCKLSLEGAIEGEHSDLPSLIGLLVVVYRCYPLEPGHRQVSIRHGRYPYATRSLTLSGTWTGLWRESGASRVRGRFPSRQSTCEIHQG